MYSMAKIVLGSVSNGGMFATVLLFEEGCFVSESVLWDVFSSRKSSV